MNYQKCLLQRRLGGALQLQSWLLGLITGGCIVTHSADHLKAKPLIDLWLQQLPADLTDKITSFQWYFINLPKTHNYPPSFINLSNNFTVASVDTKRVAVKTSGYEKIHFTTVLAGIYDWHNKCDLYLNQVQNHRMPQKWTYMLHVQVTMNQVHTVILNQVWSGFIFICLYLQNWLILS